MRASMLFESQRSAIILLQRMIRHERKLDVPKKQQRGDWRLNGREGRLNMKKHEKACAEWQLHVDWEDLRAKWHNEPIWRLNKDFEAKSEVTESQDNEEEVDDDAN
jgi:hypothetical protein